MLYYNIKYLTKLLLEVLVIVYKLENIKSRKQKLLSSSLVLLNEQNQEKKPQFLLPDDILGEEVSVCKMS